MYMNGSDSFLIIRHDFDRTRNSSDVRFLVRSWLARASIPVPVPAPVPMLRAEVDRHFRERDARSCDSAGSNWAAVVVQLAPTAKSTTNASPAAVGGWAGWSSGEVELAAVQRAGKWPDGRKLGRGHGQPYLKPCYARSIRDGSKTVEGRPGTGWASNVKADEYPSRLEQMPFSLTCAAILS